MVTLVFLGGVQIADVYADKEVIILNGNVDPQCIETSCYDKTVITIETGETITWINEDVPAHTIVSGSAFTGQDGGFDSGLILPEKTWDHTFILEGEYPYYCVLHPWATGLVKVTGDEMPETDEMIEEREDLEIDTEDNRKVQQLGFIGQKVGDGRDYLMSYISTGSISSSFVNHEDNYILFTFSTPAPVGDEIIMKLKSGMIENPTFVEVNGVPLDSYPNGYQYVKQGEDMTLMFKSPVELWEVKIYGTQVVPEFGSLAMMILAVTIISIIAITAKSKIRMNV